MADTSMAGCRTGDSCVYTVEDEGGVNAALRPCGVGWLRKEEILPRPSLWHVQRGSQTSAPATQPVAGCAYTGVTAPLPVDLSTSRGSGEERTAKTPCTTTLAARRYPFQ
jgi:hypothetical protein